MPAQVRWREVMAVGSKFCFQWHALRGVIMPAANTVLCKGMAEWSGAFTGVRWMRLIPSVNGDRIKEKRIRAYA